MAGIIPVHATVTVTTAGTRAQVNSTASIYPSSIYFEAAGANTGYIYVGLVTVSSTVYIARLSAGAGFSLSSDGTGTGGHLGKVGLNLASLYVDSSVSGEKVQVTYVYNQSTGL